MEQNLAQASARFHGEPERELKPEQRRTLLSMIERDPADVADAREGFGDRLAASLDYEINLRFEFQIMQLHEKLDRQIMDRFDRIEAMLNVRAPDTAPGA